MLLFNLLLLISSFSPYLQALFIFRGPNIVSPQYFFQLNGAEVCRAGYTNYPQWQEMMTRSIEVGLL